MEINEIITNIKSGKIDMNNMELFMSAMIKGFLYNINQELVLRGEKIPHFILNTGDDFMYLDVKGQDFSKEPYQISNENYVYNKIPRCIVNTDGIEILEDQITSPYTRGDLDLELDDTILGLNAEFRRIPLTLSVSLKYYVDSFTDSLALTQMIISKMLFIKTFKFDYLGQTMQASYKVPTSYSTEKNITFDGGTTEQKLRSIELQITIETNMPVYDPKTVIANNQIVIEFEHETKSNKVEITKIIK
jgi:hypothetical protein